MLRAHEVSGPVARFARQIAGHGYIVAAPSSYHEFVGPEALAYDGPGTDRGNALKVRKVRRTALTPLPSLLLAAGYKLSWLGFAEAKQRHDNQKLAAYDEDATLAVSTLLALPTCTGRIGATGMCLGGHLAYRCALDRRVAAAVSYFATDIHSHGLGEGMKDDSLERAGEIKGELVMVRTCTLSLRLSKSGFLANASMLLG